MGYMFFSSIFKGLYLIIFKPVKKKKKYFKVFKVISSTSYVCNAFLFSISIKFYIYKHKISIIYFPTTWNTASKSQHIFF